MDLTPERKAYIDGLGLEALLRGWRFSPAGDLWFQGDTGAYWSERINKLKNEDYDKFVRTSKSVGWKED